MKWTDHLTVVGTQPKAAHVNELRRSVNEGLRALGLPTVVFTDDPMVPGITVVKRAHLAEIRKAVKGYCANADCM